MVITYHQQQEAAQQTMLELEALGVRATAIQMDLSGTAQLDLFIGEFKGVLTNWNHKSFDILVNNAGVLRLATFDKVSNDLNI